MIPVEIQCEQARWVVELLENDMAYIAYCLGEGEDVSEAVRAILPQCQEYIRSALYERLAHLAKGRK